MQYSVLVTSRNEGEKLRKTVDDVLRHAPEEMEIIIIDDASNDGSTEFLSDSAYNDSPICCVRNDRCRGLIYNRAKSAELAQGEYIAFLDAHCAVSSGWLEALRAELETIEGRGLVTPNVYKLRTDWTLDLASGGAAACTIVTPFWEFGFTSPWKIDGKICTCTIGGMAWMCRRDWYHHVGGLDSSMQVWGLENIDVPLRTWAAGGWCLTAENVKVGHLYNERATLRMNDADYVYNKIRAAHNVFTAETFSKVMKVLLHLSGFPEAMKRVYDERHSLAPAKDRFESLRERSDDWIIDTFRLPVLESPTFHLAPRRPASTPPDMVRRPLVSVIVPLSRQTADLDSLLTSLLLKRTYGRFDVLLTADEDTPEKVMAVTQSWSDHPRVQVISGATHLKAITKHVGHVNYLAFLPTHTIAVDEYWIENFLLLAERRPRMLMACPRTRWQEGRDSDLPHEFSYENIWDWNAQSFFREHTEHPSAPGPYQIMSCPETLIFVSRDALDFLGGFDAIVSEKLPIADLAIQGWLSGLEVLCHPEISVTCLRSPKKAPLTSPEPGIEYFHVLPAVTYFTSFRRQLCREKCPQAEPLLLQHAEHIEKRRRELLARAKYDDDWLFFKFGIDTPHDNAIISSRDSD